MSTREIIKPDWAKFRRDFMRGIMICFVAVGVSATVNIIFDLVAE